jgi:acetyl-CoA acetyltransferase
MTERVAIAGWGSRVGTDEPIERDVRASVREALSSAGLALDAIDMVVTVGSDLLDGGMVATRSGVAGSFGRELMTVPSSAGHAFAAAATQIESGAARTVLLAGWGEGSKAAARDSRIIQADPFYARPVGADATALALLQAQRLVATGRLDPERMAAYAALMRDRVKPTPTPCSGAAGWLLPSWCDGAGALVLTRADADAAGIAIRDFGMSFRPYCPAPEEFDPAFWVEAAIGRMRDPMTDDTLALAVVEIGAPTPFGEAVAMADILEAQHWEMADQRVNPSGGGAAAHFGPATGLMRIIAAADFLTRQPTPAIGAAIDLAGPIGQAATVILLETAGAAS